MTIRPPTDPAGRVARWAGSSTAVWMAVLGLVLLRLLLIRAAPLQPAEWQQAHVAWAWSRGRIPYRDIMDLAPPLWAWWERWLLAWIGPHASILGWLRVAAQLWHGLALYALWLIGRRIYGARPAVAAVLLVGLYPAWFMAMGQATGDGLWSALVLSALALLVTAHPANIRWRACGAGGLLGLAWCLSPQMAALMALSAVAAIALTLRRIGSSAPAGLRWMVCGIVVMVLVPTSGLLWFSHHGVKLIVPPWWPDERLTEGALSSDGRLLGGLLLAVAGVVWLSLRRWPGRRDQSEEWRLFLRLMAWLYFTLVLLAWPWYGRPDVLPLLALCGLTVSGEVAAWPGWRSRLAPLACAALVAIELICMVWALPPGRDALRGERATLATVLRYSEADAPVMDACGEAVFRRRPYYICLIAPALLRHIPDTVADELVRNRVHMVIRTALSPLSDSFVARNYLPLAGEVYVAGRRIGAAVDGLPERGVELEVPGDYTLTDGLHAVPAALDGRPAATHWQLAAGHHDLSTDDHRALLLIDTHAWDAGWRPGPAASRVW
ncbi:glycosyltransferase family protein [Frateuria aurantia]